MSARLKFLAVLGILLAVAGCLITSDDYTKGCNTVAQCPSLSGYRCVSPTAWPLTDCASAEKDCICQANYPPDHNTLDSGEDGGFDDDAGPTPDYCTVIEPILIRSCVGTCHGSQMGYPLAPTTFRLDYYYQPTLPDGGLGLPGAQSQLALIGSDVASMTMPKSDFEPQPTQVERNEIVLWVNRGGPFGAGGCEGTDAGDDDAGTDAGPSTVSFATDIKPLFTINGCNGTGCHDATTKAGNMNLTESSAYTSLVDVDTNCKLGGVSLKRVKPYDQYNSMLWRKLTPDGGYCGATMPKNSIQLRVNHSGEFIQIQTWIVEGARNN